MEKLQRPFESAGAGRRLGRHTLLALAAMVALTTACTNSAARTTYSAAHKVELRQWGAVHRGGFYVVDSLSGEVRYHLSDSRAEDVLRQVGELGFPSADFEAEWLLRLDTDTDMEISGQEALNAEAIRRTLCRETLED